MALFFLLLVFLLVVLLITLFIFPPTRWVKTMTKGEKERLSKINRGTD
ncbi:MAG TPA: hypothetical protein VIY49_12300 [Bryobacteraceae bacterium]